MFEALRSLELPSEHYVIFGSGPMLLHGIRDRIGDLDVLARGEAWARATTFAQPAPAPSAVGFMVRLFGGRIDVFDSWVTEDWDVDGLIESAEVFDGLPYAPLSAVLAWKRTSGRPKDKDDVVALEEYLRSGDAMPPA